MNPSNNTTCKFCSGKGWTLDKWATCPKCHGTGHIEAARATGASKPFEGTGEPTPDEIGIVLEAMATTPDRQKDVNQPSKTSDELLNQLAMLRWGSADATNHYATLADATDDYFIRRAATRIQSLIESEAQQAYIRGRRSELEILGYTDGCDCMTCAEVKFKLKGGDHE